MKNTLERMNSRLEDAEQTSELRDRVRETTKLKRRKKNFFKRRIG